MPYLTGTEIDATLTVVVQRSAPGSRLVVAYVVPSLARALWRRASRLALRRGQDVFRHEPQRSFFDAERMGALLARHGLRVLDDRDLLEIAMSLGMDTASIARYAGGTRVVVAGRCCASCSCRTGASSPAGPPDAG